MEEENKEIKEVESLVETNGEVALENNTNIKIADDVISVIAGVAVSRSTWSCSNVRRICWRNFKGT